MSDNIKLEWKGLAGFLGNIRDKQPKLVQKAVGKAAYREGVTIMAEAKTLCPVDNGFLKASGHVRKPEYDGPRVSVTIGFGGVAEAYAVVQHENLEFHHTVGQAKYLEQPFAEAKDGMTARLAEAITGNLTDEGDEEV